MPFLSAVFQGEGLRPASRLLRGLVLRPPSGRHGGAGGWLEDRERWGRRVGVRVGTENESEAVGDAQQVRFSLVPSSHPPRGRERAQTLLMSGEWMACSLSLLQASCQTCTLQHQHPGNSQHPWRQDTARGLHYRWWPHSSPQVATVRPLDVKRNISAGKTEILNLLFKMFVSPVGRKKNKMASVWLVHTMNRSAANLPPPMLSQIVVLVHQSRFHHG